jgi:saccharopine dehydrogenase (NAD+, L-lysine-forming)
VRVLLIGAGAVGSAIASIAARRDFLEHCVVASLNESRARRAAAVGQRFTAAQIDARDDGAIVRLIKDHRITHVMNAADQRLTMPIFDATCVAGADYVDMALSPARRHGRRSDDLGVKLGDDQFAAGPRWEAAGRLALVGMGIEPGLADVFARYAADHLFDTIEELSVRDGTVLTIDGYDFAPAISIWSTIEMFLSPPLVWERDRGWYTTEPFSEPEVFRFPDGIGELECVNIEHESVLLMPRWIDANRVTTKYGLGKDFIDVLRVIRKVGLDRTEPLRVGDVEVNPRDVVAAALPDPTTLGERMRGTSCAGLWVTGTGKDGLPRSTYLYHSVDNGWSMREHGHQCVAWQTAVNAVVALELLSRGAWAGAGVLGPEAFDPVPFLDLLNEHGAPWRADDR